MDLTSLADRVRGLVDAQPGRVILGIAGAPGAGKSTLAQSLVSEMLSGGRSWIGSWVAYIPMDGFHLADMELHRLGRRDRKGAPDTFDAAGYVALLRRLRADDEDVVYAPGFEREIEQPVAGNLPIIRDARLIVTEGNYLLLDDPAWRPIRAELDEAWFCEIAEQTRLDRLIARHERFGKSHDDAVAWAYGSDQRNAELVATTRSRADLIVSDLSPAHFAS